MTFLWILLAVLYVACWVYFGMATFRKGHYWMFEATRSGCRSSDVRPIEAKS